MELIFEFVSHLSSLQRAASGRIARDATDAIPHWQWLRECARQTDGTYPIFEGTSEIQRLVIARNIRYPHPLTKRARRARRRGSITVRMLDPARRSPAGDTLRWVERAVGEGRVVGVRRMVGGISSSVHRVTVVDRAGARGHVVLRRWVGQEPERARRLVEREGRVLSALEGTAVPAPRLVGVSDGTETSGVPAILMTRVAGHVHLAPRDPDTWLAQAAALLPVVHGAAVEADAWEPRAREPQAPPAWIDPTVWNAAQAVLAQAPPTPREAQRSFVHTDYQHFNLLWRRERLTGIVDWVAPNIGPSDVDVAHSRLNLAVLYSPEWSERFRLAYEAEAGRSVHPWFDLNGITRFHAGWQDFIPVQVGGRVTVDVAGMPARVEQLIVDTLARM
ncbi:MAG TPA: phosphotransferase [Acidimicrobiia bacterium]